MTRLLFLLLLMSGPAYAVTDPAEMLPDAAQEARAERLGQSFRCLVCQNESIEDSGADLAHDLRRAVREHVVAGDTDAQVTAFLVARYGEFVRLRPPIVWQTAILWGSPILALLAGLAVVLLNRRRPAAAPAPLSDDERARLATLT